MQVFRFDLTASLTTRVVNGTRAPFNGYIGYTHKNEEFNVFDGVSQAREKSLFNCFVNLRGPIVLP